MREAVHRLKYRKQFDYGKRLSPLLFETLQNDPLLRSFEAHILVPVPLHKSRMRARGFNQSTILARGLSEISGVPLIDALIRVRKTPPQVGLSAEQRRKNVRGAFEVAWQDLAEHSIRERKRKTNTERPLDGIDQQVKDKRILLIDDVFTTGATLSECSAVLKRAGASEVMALTLARQASPEESEPVDEHWNEIVV